jgi:hypothetical protein
MALRPIKGYVITPSLYILIYWFCAWIAYTGKQFHQATSWNRTSGIHLASPRLGMSKIYLIYAFVKRSAVSSDEELVPSSIKLGTE